MLRQERRIRHYCECHLTNGPSARVAVREIAILRLSVRELPQSLPLNHVPSKRETDICAIAARGDDQCRLPSKQTKRSATWPENHVCTACAAHNNTFANQMPDEDRVSCGVLHIKTMVVAIVLRRRKYTIQDSDSQ